MSQIDSDSFKVIAGDDLFGSRNIYEEYKELGTVQLKTFLPMYFSEDKVWVDNKRIVDFLYNYGHKKTYKYYLSSMKKGCFLHTPSTIYKRNMYDMDCQQFNMQFRLFEDDPTWYSMIKNNKNIDITFIPYNIVLYRIHNNSVSNGSAKNNPFKEELNKLHNIYINDSKGVERIFLQIRYLANVPRLLNPYKYYELFFRIYKVVYIILNGNLRKQLKQIKEDVKREQIYLMEVINQK